eukprot:GFUD01029561.1.p1 GENE.GFUD01029561.1~~GFUD01029561.1.p1  ORF type:complete len:306 (-),score=93.32 GFUD01029561.1:170-1087(-)
MGELKTNYGENVECKCAKVNMSNVEIGADECEVNDDRPNKDLLKHLQSLVECPVCLGSIRTVPVSCCPSGHVVCTDCRSQLVSCPVCRTVYPSLQLVSHLAAGIIDKIPHPCKFKAYGCSQSLLLSSLPAHETCCSYRLVSCPNILCNLKISLAGLYRHMIVNGCASQHDLKVTSSLPSVSTVLMTGRVKNVDELLYKIPLVFSYEGNMFLIIKKQSADMIQFSASILGSPEQGRQFMVSIAVFSERMPCHVVEYKGFANSVDGPVWCALTVHKDHMGELLDQVEENEFQQKFKYHYKVKISRNE